ncbi:Subunit of the glycosylphosphatidylinositol transamidase complex-like protein [Coemansia spiralis]|nr:Subunit of the glycosylphosphatidylinositol transamidase complex-like protein [Coemansia spiralis]
MQLLLWIALLAAAASGRPTETFTEDLLVQPLADGKVLQHYEFTVQRQVARGDEEQHNYRLFPRQLGEIARRYGVHELKLALRQGGWRDKWGYAPTAVQGTAGAELMARIRNGGSVDAQWRGLANALSGVFCASLNFVGSESTISPRLTFGADAANGTVLRHGYLARENVCTENLTPWIKQLPCQAQSGIAALLNPHRLYNMHYHSMGVALAPATDAVSGRPVLRYTQHVSVVLDPQTFGLGANWTLGQLMDRSQLAAPCPVANQSTVRVVAPGPDLLRTVPRADRIEPVAGHTVHTFDLRTRRIADIEIAPAPAAEWLVSVDAAPAVTAHRYIAGHGGTGGGIEATLTNRLDEAVRVVYLDTLPWYLRVYSHTLRLNTMADGGRAAAVKVVPARVLFTPAVDRGQPSVLELEVELPARSRTVLRYDIEKGFLKYTEHPPDANRGFNIGPAIVSYRIPETALERPLVCAGQAGCAVQAQTELFLATLPTPDFSMPYNVVSLTCTVLALFFGRVFNLLTRDFAILKPADA